jgi:hypothetical protein
MATKATKATQATKATKARVSHQGLLSVKRYGAAKMMLL